MHRTLHRFSLAHLLLLCSTLFGIALPTEVRAGERDPYSTRDYTGPGLWPTTATLGNHLYFTWYSPSTGMELWKSDGTQQGTSLLMDVYPGESSADPSQVHSVNNRLLFFGDDGVHGRELWVSDGTTVGTKLLKDFYPGPKSGQLDSESEIRSQVVGNRLFFVVATSQSTLELWVSDATTSGTKLVRTMDAALLFPIEMASFKGKLYFTGTSQSSATNLWVSDGTSQGTQQIKEVTTADGSTFFRSLVATTTALYMVGDLVGWPSELWTSDGTSVGTRMIRDYIGYPYLLTPIGSRIIFGIDPQSAKQLWTSDGTLDRTYSLDVSGVKPTEYNIFMSQNPLPTFANVSYFYSEGAAGVELWRSDGTKAGTRSFGVIGSDIPLRWEYIQTIVPRSGGAFFHDAQPRQTIWYADDTTGQLRRLTSSSKVTRMLIGVTPRGFAIYVTDEDDVIPSIWASDGTAATTRQIYPYRAFAPAVMR